MSRTNYQFFFTDPSLQEEADRAELTLSGMIPQYLMCGLCNKIIIHSLTTLCEHRFCQVCLHEYFVYLASCPDCGYLVRKSSLSKNIFIDNFAHELVKDLAKGEGNASFLQEYEERKQRHDRYLERREIRNIKEDMKVDVQDGYGVWHKAKILTIQRKEKTAYPAIHVKYEFNNRKEVIKNKTYRIATRGFYTDRALMPKLQKCNVLLQDPEDQKVIYTIPEDGLIEE